MPSFVEIGKAEVTKNDIWYSSEKKLAFCPFPGPLRRFRRNFYGFPVSFKYIKFPGRYPQKCRLESRRQHKTPKTGETRTKDTVKILCVYSKTICSLSIQRILYSDSGEVLKQMGAGDFFGEIGILNMDGGINR